ncbi:MAG: diguanylate cyclase [Phycisphaerales bacterium]|nr:diguanylate cyclase [Phycisphaerales bacterium]
MVYGSAHFFYSRVRSAWLVTRFVDAVTSLQFKTTALVVVLTLSVTTAVAAYLLQSGGELARQQHGEEILSSAALLARAASPMLASDDPQAIQRLADEAANGNPLLYVIVMDADGAAVASAEYRNARVPKGLERNGMAHAPVPGLPIVYAGDGSDVVLMDVTYPITVREDVDASNATPRKLLGYVRTGMVANNWQRTMASRLDIVIGVGLLSMVAAIPFGFLLVRRIVEPLDGLAEAMIGFSDGKLDMRSNVRRRDEIGRLASAFNQMADQHQQTHLRMMRLNAELEERVAYRTKQLRELASRDPLTGLYNRRHFGEVFGRCFAEAMRYGTDLSCLMIDLDDFKQANDAFGHQTGDELLQLAAGTIVSQLRTADVAARYGGDEFILLLPQTDADRAHVLGERIITRFTSELSDRLPDATVRMSVGIASLHSLRVTEAEALIRAADNALYDAKTTGKNRIVDAAPAA